MPQGRPTYRSVRIHENTYTEINRLRLRLLEHGVSISIMRFIDELVKRYGSDFVEELISQNGGENEVQ